MDEEERLKEQGETLRDHEKRLIRAEVLYEAVCKDIKDMSSTMIERFGRLEKGIDTLRDDAGKEGKIGSATKAQVAMLVSVLSPIATGLIVYFLTRGR